MGVFNIRTHLALPFFASMTAQVSSEKLVQTFVAAAKFAVDEKGMFNRNRSQSAKRTNTMENELKIIENSVLYNI